MGKPYIDFGALKACVSMTQVLEHYGLMVQMRSIKGGEGLEGPCPIHKGTTPDQFKVSITKNCWNCFSDCKCGGNVLDFVARMENVDVHEAAVRVNDWFKLGLGQAPSAQRNDRSRDGSPPKASANGNGNGGGASKAPPASLPEDEPPEEIGHNEPLKFELQNLKTDHDYFKERGLTPATVAEFGLGVAGGSGRWGQRFHFDIASSSRSHPHSPDQIEPTT